MARSGLAALAGLMLLGCGGDGTAAVEPRGEEESPLSDPVTP